MFLVAFKLIFSSCESVLCSSDVNPTLVKMFLSFYYFYRSQTWFDYLLSLPWNLVNDMKESLSWSFSINCYKRVHHDLLYVLFCSFFLNEFWTLANHNFGGKYIIIIFIFYWCFTSNSFFGFLDFFFQ